MKIGLDELAFILGHPFVESLCLDSPHDRTALLTFVSEMATQNRETIEPAVRAIAGWLHGFWELPLASYTDGYNNGITWPEEWVRSRHLEDTSWWPGGPHIRSDLTERWGWRLNEESVRENEVWRQGWREGFEIKRRLGLPSRRPGERPEDFLASTKR